MNTYVASDQVRPDLLVFIPRELNRRSLNLHNVDLGYDVWHAYEFSYLTSQGYCETCQLKFVIPANSPYIVESKSLRLYLNSYNMVTFNKDNPQIWLSQIERDLSEGLQAKCKILFSRYTGEELYRAPAADARVPAFTVRDEDFIYVEPTLRSNCRVTNQPGWGYLVVVSTTPQISIKSLRRMIMRMHADNYFCEEICEKIYHELQDSYGEQDLLVACFYSRRGGIDINPIRASSPEILSIATNFLRRRPAEIIRADMQ